MQITFKLFVGHTEYLPAEFRHGNQMALEVEAAAAIVQLIEPFRTPPHLVHIMLVTACTWRRQTAPAR